MIRTCHYSSPLGSITMASDGTSLTGLWFDGQKFFGSTLPPVTETGDLPVFEETRRWLDLYFQGKQPDFTPPLTLEGSPFRQAVWKILLTIPYGHTMTYGGIARQMGNTKMSAQAVGGAVGHNPISIIVPCHRVLGSGGCLTGYAAGIAVKQALLDLEQAKQPQALPCDIRTEVR